MTMLTATRPSAHPAAQTAHRPGHVAASQSEAALAAIHQDAVNLAVWHRCLSPALAAESQALAAHPAASLHLEGRPERLAPKAAMQEAGWPQSPHLAADIEALAARFAAIMASPEVSLRLEIIEGDACRKYHADYVSARLITSYAGPGSQWLTNAQAEALGADGARAVSPNSLNPGDVALFKGRRWSDTPIIHRSPPIAGTGQRRLVLVINPASEQP